MNQQKILQNLKHLKRGLIYTAGAFLFIELGLRVFGLGQWIVYDESTEYEYFQKPNMSLSRFSNLFTTNNYGMRSSPEPTPGCIKVLKFGDSVLNGGSKMSDSETVSSLIAGKLADKAPCYQVFNVSAGSWGPDNAFAYLKNRIDFKPDLLVLLFSSHDFNDNMHHRTVVGKHPSWPDRQPLFAIEDLWKKVVKYKLGALFNMEFEELRYLDGFNNSRMNEGWSQFVEYTRTNNIPMIVYLHPEQSELLSGNWNEQGEHLIEWLEANQVSYIDGIEKGYLKNSYVDNIHLNANGHRSLEKNIFPSLEEKLR